MAIEVGTEAPDFELHDQNHRPVRLSSFRGDKNVLLVFVPFAFTGICTGELCSIRDQLDQFVTDDSVVLAVSCDSVFTQHQWAERDNLTYPLLSDFWPHGAVAQSYGVFDEGAGCAVRGSFVIDKQGVVRWTVINAIPDARSTAEQLAALTGL
jgi:mycoredoxin-dependent peroxiredoxin